MASTPTYSLADSTTSLMGIDAETISLSEERTALLDRNAARRMSYSSGVATPNTCTPATRGNAINFFANTHCVISRLLHWKRYLCLYKTSQVLYTLASMDTELFFRPVRVYLSQATVPRSQSSNRLGGDVLAGLTVAALLVPQSVSYATSLAGISPIAGLVRSLSVHPRLVIGPILKLHHYFLLGFSLYPRHHIRVSRNIQTAECRARGSDMPHDGPSCRRNIAGSYRR